jgi:hypothetical protein
MNDGFLRLVTRDGDQEGDGRTEELETNSEAIPRS